MPEHIAPRFAGVAVFFKFRERFVERLPFGGRGCAAVEEVSLVEFGEPGEELRTVADGQLGKFFKDLSFAHGGNLARMGFSGKLVFQMWRALMWLIPDRRIESLVDESGQTNN